MAIVSTGPITSHGPLLISGLKNGHDFTGAVTTLPPEKLLRASMASNLDGDNAISLDAGAEVNGNVQARGRIHLAPDDVVRGAV
ncbi:hypothetical protein NL533_30975, partial [Klebsiella pneumoniae]|nr:hypothetical protein [Klebsiella pneumoniae]